jgi:hypothetical protein
MRFKSVLCASLLPISTVSVLLLVGSPVEAQQSAYEGRIDGDFEGWNGDTVYKLADGHIIQQSSYHYHYHYAYSPKVIIYGSDGEYKLIVEGDSDEPISIVVLK